MAVSITYNSDLYSLFYSYYSFRESDLMESLAWLMNDEKNMGTSEEQSTLIKYLAQYYFFAIYQMNLNFNPSWTYLDWLTQAEYDTIIAKMSIEFNTHDMLLVPGKLPTPAPVPGGTVTGAVYETVFDTVGGSLVTITTTIVTEPIVISVFDVDGVPVPLNAGVAVFPRFSGGVYVFDIYSAESVAGYKLKIIY